MLPIAFLRSAYIATFWALAVLFSGPVAAQQAPLKGMVWTPPGDRIQAVQDIYAMAGAGVEAVRTDFFGNDEVLGIADTLGLHIYLDLPLSYLSVSELADTLASAQASLDAALDVARRHASIRAIGLAGHSDTSDPAACAWLEGLSSRLREAAPDISTYYVTLFSQDDVCADAVDFVLMDVLDRSDPSARIEKAGMASVGVGALGTGVGYDDFRGLLVPFSPERQARYFENALPELLDSSLRAVFVYRWRDRLSSVMASDPVRYGLHTPDGRTRAAFEVISGFFSGRRTVFAFDEGTPPPEPFPWVILFGWTIILAFGTGYALSPRFRYMLPRYFRAHAFFVEAVHANRENLSGVNFATFCMVVVTSGLTGFLILYNLAVTDAFMVAMHRLPSFVQSLAGQMIGKPVLCFLLAGGIHAFALGIWAIAWSLLLRLGPRIVRVRQVFMLIVWAHWPYLLVMAGAMVASSLPAPSGQVASMLAIAWICFGIFSFIQILIDIWLMARVSIWPLVLGALLYPFVWVSIFLFNTLLRHPSEVSFVWHAALRQ